MKRWLLGISALAALLVVAAVLWLAATLRADPPGVYRHAAEWRPLTALPEGSRKPLETVYYTSLRPSNWDVFLFEPGPDGRLGAPVRLTDHAGLDYNATFTPDGRWVVFTSERVGTADLYALDLAAYGSDGRDPPEPIRLTSHPAMDDAADVSPDGSRIAFVSTRDGNPDVFVMPFRPDAPEEAESGAENISRHPHGDFNPDFSPDGEQIVFSSNRSALRWWNPTRLVDGAGYQTSIYVVRADGSDLRKVVGGIGIRGSPRWSSDGSRIVYQEMRGEDRSRIAGVGVDGGEREAISDETLFAMAPAVGPGGGIAFVGQAPGEEGERSPFRELHGGALYRMNADGSEVERLTSSEAGWQQPDVDDAGRIVAHGDGPLDGLVRMPNEVPVAWPHVQWYVELPDRILHVRALRAYFPSHTPVGGQLYALPWIHEEKGWPPGPAPVLRVAGDGSAWEVAFESGDDGFIWGPVVSRNGEWIVYAKGPRTGSMPDQNVDVWLASLDGSEPVNLTDDPTSNDAFPDLSADGSRVVFRGGAKGEGPEGDRNFEIWVMEVEGRKLRRLTRTEGVETMPAISPDGRWVVYATDRMGKGLKLWIQPVDDPSDPGRLLEPGRAEVVGVDVHPRFSPDGRWVVFTSDRGGLHDEFVLSGMFPQPYGDLWAVPVDGGHEVVRLTHDKWEDGLPTWSVPPR